MSISQSTILIIVGVVVVLGVLVFATGKSEPTPEEPQTGEVVEGDTTIEEGATPTPSTGTGSAKPSTSVTQPKPTPAPSPTPSPTPTPTPAPEPGPEETAPTPQPTPAEPYKPAFQATTRITPEIPSENERATLPACNGKTFSYIPIDLNIVTGITGHGHAPGAPDEYTVLSVVGSGDLNKYELYAPADVWVTRVEREVGVSVDDEDWTIYFALCRDVFGYATHVKEVSENMRDVAEGRVAPFLLIARGEYLGKVGRNEGAFGLGVIDLRIDRALSNPSQYSIRANFAACPFTYFASPAAFWAKYSGNGICVAP